MTSARRRRINQAAHAGLLFPPTNAANFLDEDESKATERARRFAQQQQQRQQRSKSKIGGIVDLASALLAALVAALCLFLLLRHR